MLFCITDTPFTVRISVHHTDGVSYKENMSKMYGFHLALGIPFLFPSFSLDYLPLYQEMTFHE